MKYLVLLFSILILSGCVRLAQAEIVDGGAATATQFPSGLDIGTGNVHTNWLFKSTFEDFGRIIQSAPDAFIVKNIYFEKGGKYLVYINSVFSNSASNGADVNSQGLRVLKNGFLIMDAQSFVDNTGVGTEFNSASQAQIFDFEPGEAIEIQFLGCCTTGGTSKVNYNIIPILSR
jgi:hypothetical protein